MNRIKTKAYLEVTLEQAREWYESGNEDLKKLALTAFSEEMLIPSFKEIVESEEDYSFWNTLVCPPSMTEQLSSLASLQIVANYLNKGWIKTEGNTGYFLGKGSSLSGKTETDIKGVYVVMHQNVKYPGIVYFRTVADAQKAVKILGKKLLPLFEMIRWCYQFSWQNATLWLQRSAVQIRYNTHSIIPRTINKLADVQCYLITRHSVESQESLNK